MTSKESQWPLSTQQFHSMPFSKETAMGWVRLHETYGATRLTGFQNRARLERSKWCIQAPMSLYMRKRKLRKMAKDLKQQGLQGHSRWRVYTEKKKSRGQNEHVACWNCNSIDHMCTIRKKKRILPLRWVAKGHSFFC